MGHRTPLVKVVDNLWTRRIIELKRVADLNIPNLGREFGYFVRGYECPTITRVLRGGVPSHDFIRRLKEVEARHEDEFEGVRQGWIFWNSRGRRIDCRPTSRPQDLKDLGSVGLENGRGKAPRTVDGVDRLPSDLRKTEAPANNRSRFG